MGSVNRLALYLMLIVPIGLAVLALLALAVDGLWKRHRPVPASWPEESPAALRTRVIAG